MTWVPHEFSRLPGIVRRRVFSTSLLPKILVVLAIALAVGSVVTAAFETSATRDALRQQTREVLQRELSVAQAELAEDQRVLDTTLRGTAQRIALLDLSDSAQRVALLSELERTQRVAGLDGLAAFTPDLRPVESVGVELTPPTAIQPEALETGTPRILVRTPGGAWSQVTMVPVHTDRLRLLLVGGRLFGDAAAFELRALVGHDVLLFADGELVGSTLTETPGPAAELLDSTGAQPAELTLRDRRTFVGTTTLATGPGSGGVSGAIGVAVSDPVAALDRSLTRNRVVSALLLALIALGVAWLLFRYLTRPLRELVDTAQRIATGDLDATFEARSSDEVGELAAALESMRRAIRDQVDVILHQAQSLRASTKRLAHARDDERRRLANDLHDGLQQQLVMLRMRLGLARRLAGQDDVEGAAQQWSRLVADVDAAIQTLRETSQDIFPSILRDRGLQGALRSLAGRAAISIHVSAEPDPLPRMPQDVEANAYFLVAEAITNAIKHGDAGEVHVAVRHEDAALRVRVSDDGGGFRAGEDPTLVHLRDRATAVGGHLDVETGADGTLVAAVLPLAAPAEHPRPSVGGQLSPSSAAGRTARPPPSG